MVIKVTAVAAVIATTLLLGVASILPHWLQHGTRAAGGTILLADPTDEHNGETFYLSVHGYRPRTHLSFVIACPSFFDPTAREYQNVALYDGPVTNASGDFSGYPIMGFQLRGLPSSPCTIMANYPGLNQVFVSTRPALYIIIAKDQRKPSA